MNRATINIEIVSDPVCPWCYIGKRRLEDAMARRPGIDFRLSWKPFQLNPDMPRGGRNRLDYYRAKFGEMEAKALLERLRQTGAAEGIAFCSDPKAMAPNTLSAHVLMSWADDEERVDPNELVEKLFHAHHVACEDIGDASVLTRIAGEVGMDQSTVAERLASAEDEDRVTRQIQESFGLGVSGVPFFIVNGKYGISGAQPADTLVAAFDRIAVEDA